MKSNNQGGLDYETVPENYRAKKVDLITFPPNITGVSCKNCMYADLNSNPPFCTNDKVKLNVTEKMCCSLWNAENTERSWKK